MSSDFFHPLFPHPSINFEKKCYSVIMDTDLNDKRTLKSKLGSFWWRFNNLYQITDESARRVTFRPRPIQKDFISNMHHRNIILKSRQHGFTTQASVHQLDCTLWQPNIKCGLVADTLPKAQEIFHEKVIRTYNDLPDWLKAERPLLSQDKMTLRVGHANGDESSMIVSTSLRSGTFQYVHVSEIAKLCANSAEKERELISGTLQSGYYMNITLESTAETSSGYFYNTCQTAEQKKLRGDNLSPLDYKFFFYPWYANKDSWIADEFIVPGMVEKFAGYFARECPDIDLSDNQKMWYVKKREEIDDLSLMYREYPSNSAEAFRVANAGSYYHENMLRAWEAKRIVTERCWDSDLVVHVVMDIGVGDSTCLGFFCVSGEMVYLVDYYEMHGRGFGHYVDIMREKGYNYGRIIGPHDFGVTEFSSGVSRVESAWVDHGVRIDVLPKRGLDEGIASSRRVLDRTVFYEPNVKEELVHLQEYREAFSKSLGTYTGKPLHDKHSHGSDMFRYLSEAVENKGMDLANYTEKDLDILERCVL